MSSSLAARSGREKAVLGESYTERKKSRHSIWRADLYRCRRPRVIRRYIVYPADCLLPDMRGFS